MEGLHGELFGVSGLLGGPSPSPGPSLTGRTRRRLLTGVLCHTPAYTSTPAGLHSAPVEEPGGTRGLVHLWCTCSGASSAKPEMQLDQICTGCPSTDYTDLHNKHHQAQPAWRFTTIVMLSEMEVASPEAPGMIVLYLRLQSATTHPRALLKKSAFASLVSTHIGLVACCQE